MRLVRSLSIRSEVKNQHLGPEEGGKFFALEGFNDLPFGSVDYSVELSALLNLGCRVWLGNAEDPDGWEEIENPSQLEGRWQWEKKEVPAGDGWGWEMIWFLKPYIPEFYVKPFDWAIRKKLRMMKASIRSKELYKNF